jgi:dihydroorotase
VYDLILKGGRIIDPSQGMDRSGDLAVHEGKVAEIAESIDQSSGRRVIPVAGKIVAPGLIDLHCHPGSGFTWIGMTPDEIGLEAGVTLLGDAGTAGWANFPAYRSLVVEPARTDILCFLNLSSTGLVTLPEIWSEGNMDMARTEEVMAAHGDLIRGVKIRCVQALAEGVGLTAVERAKKLAQDFRLPLMVHVGETRPRTGDPAMDRFSRAAVALLDAGDVLSHYLTWEPGGLVLADGTIYPELLQAHKRGVALDPSHGLNHFSFAIARHALAAGLTPTVLTTDMATVSLPAAQSLAVMMSKFLCLGLSLGQVIEMTTINPARILGEDARRGGLKPGMAADITVLELCSGQFVFSDGKGGERVEGQTLLEPRLVLKSGGIHPAHSGYHVPPLFS